MCGIVIVGSGFETWREGGNVSFERVSEEGGIFSAFVTASEGFWESVGGREA